MKKMKYAVIGLGNRGTEYMGFIKGFHWQIHIAVGMELTQ